MKVHRKPILHSESLFYLGIHYLVFIPIPAISSMFPRRHSPAVTLLRFGILEQLHQKISVIESKKINQYCGVFQLYRKIKCVAGVTSV